jgi:uncharacterized protein YndB with AHSA1/START domain
MSNMPAHEHWWAYPLALIHVSPPSGFPNCALAPPITRYVPQDSYQHHNLRDELARRLNGSRPQGAASVPTLASNITVSGEITIEVRINAAPRFIFPFLTCPARMRTWLAPVVEFAPHVGGRFVIADLNGLRVEGEVVEVVRDSTLTLTWGGIDGLRPGQSIVKFTLTAAGEDTIVRLCHSGLPEPAYDMHAFGWRHAGLPRLKTVTEGGAPGRTYLGDIADARELAPY